MDLTCNLKDFCCSVPDPAGYFCTVESVPWQIQAVEGAHGGQAAYETNNILAHQCEYDDLSPSLVIFNLEH